MREVAVDPDMNDTLTWLQASHADDQLLASVLELRWEDLNAVVALATRDRTFRTRLVSRSGSPSTSGSHS